MDSGQTEQPIKVNMVRSERNTAGAKVMDDGSIELRVPYNFTDEQAQKMLNANHQRLLHRAAIQRESFEKRSKYILTYGNEVLLFGERRPLRPLDDGEPDVVRLQDGCIYMRGGLSEERIRIAISNLCIDFAWKVFDNKLEHYSKLMGVRYNYFELSHGKVWMGSCNNQGIIRLSWRLIMISEFVMDGDIVHELAHIKHPNHSKAFYEEIAKVQPDYKERGKALFNECNMLYSERWL